MADDVTITVHVRDLTGPGFQSVHRNLNQLQRQASSMGGSLRVVAGQLDGVASSASNAGSSLGGGAGLKGQAIGAAAVLGTTLLPTIGALAPMLSGLAVVGGGAALAMGDLKAKAKELKPAFEDWKKVAEKAVAPHTEKAVKSLKGAMKDLTPVIETGAETFGRITEKAARFADSPAFKESLAKNAQMGAAWVEEFAGSIGTFTQAFLDFGTKSGPALEAWQDLLGGFLDTGLPGMFKEMEQGISGSSQMLSGLASFLNDGLLPALGKVAGSFSEAFGPLLGELLEIAGKALLGFASVFEGAMEVFKPVTLIAADGLRALTDVLRIGSEVAGTFAKEVGGALFGALLSVAGVDTSGMTGGFTKLSDWVSQNEPLLRAAFYGIADGITTMVTIGVSMLPGLWGAFRLMSEAVLAAVDAIVSGLATAFGDLPVIGDRFKDMNRNFDEFASGVRGSLDKAGNGINAFVDEAVPRLSRAKLKMNVSEAEQNLASLKEKLDDPSLTKERRAQLKVEKEKAEEALAAAKRSLKDFDGRKATGSILGNAKGFFDAARRVDGKKFSSKSVPVSAALGAFNSAIRLINGRSVGSAYINVYNRYVDNQVAKPFRSAGGRVQRRADGGALQHFPNGGLVEGPGGPRSDSIFATFGSGASAMVSDTEYVVQSSAVKKYGLPLLDALNRGTLKLARGGVTKSMAEARKGAVGDLTVSHFGRMAGSTRSEFRSDLIRADSTQDLVNTLNQWRSTIKKATSGGVEKSLLRALDSAGKKLLAYEKQHEKASVSLQKAKDRLDELKQAASQLRESVQGGVLNAANITRRQGDGPVTVASIMGGLTASRDKSTAFAQALKDLQKRGVAGSLIEQIAEAGIEGGGLETAGALLKASGSEIKSLNSLQSQITKAAVEAGKVSADAVFGSQIRGQEKLVAAWQRTTDGLFKRMDRVAAAMEKAIEKGFGMKASGGIVGMAASGGIRSNLTWVGERGPELLDLPPGARVWSNPDSKRLAQQAWASMLNVPRGGARTSAPAPASAASNRPMLINVSIGGREFGQLWVDTGRREVRALGGLRATLGGEN
ncbi:hypothetical protein ACH5A7_20795 [Streptomyces sp. NPDC018955]|uniref:hypothetical protein n=1 Tax=Streptomyces sp. NPDC018955 TaxID=3365055 RepID=UPI0037A987A3